MPASMASRGRVSDSTPANGATIPSATGTTVRRRPAAKSGVVVAADQRERHGEEDPVQHRIGDEHADASGREGRRAEEMEVDERRRRADLPPGRRRRAGSGRRRAQAIERRRETPGACLGDREQERGQRRRREGARPGASNRRSSARFAVFGTSSQAERGPEAAEGTATQKIDRQPNAPRSTPPSAGPTLRPTAWAAAWTPSALPRRSGPAAATR